MKEYTLLPEDLKKAKEKGEVLDDYIHDDGIRNGQFYPEIKQGKSIIKISSGEYIVSWYMGEEEWNHVYDEKEVAVAFQDFKSVIMEEPFRIEDEEREDALDTLEDIFETDPDALQEALKPIIFALNQNNELIQSQSIDLLITLAKRNINLVIPMISTLKQIYLREKNQKIQRKILILIGVIGEEDPSIMKEFEQNFLEDLNSDNIPLITTLLSIYNKIGKKNKELIINAKQKIRELTKNSNLSVKTLANNLLKNIKKA